jgi:hypothetical protein
LEKKLGNLESLGPTLRRRSENIEIRKTNDPNAIIILKYLWIKKIHGTTLIECMIKK